MASEKDMKTRKALAWSACNKLNKIWHSTLANETKVHVFKTLSRAHSPLRCRNVDTHQKPTEALGWSIYQHAQTRSEHSLVRARNLRAHIWEYPAPVAKGRQEEAVVRRTLPSGHRGNNTAFIAVETLWPCPLQRPHLPRYHRKGCGNGERGPPCGHSGPRSVGACRRVCPDPLGSPDDDDESPSLLLSVSWSGKRCVTT